MPIPDAIIPTEPESEDQRELNKRYRKVNDACNALLARQLVCGKTCHWCSSKCPELQAWLDVGDENEKQC
jgi:hypothetical protein